MGIFILDKLLKKSQNSWIIKLLIPWGEYGFLDFCDSKQKMIYCNSLAFRYFTISFFNLEILDLKVVPATFLLICFVCLKERICETRKNVFYFTLKFCSWDNQIFNISDIPMSWCHQMPMHETRNTFYWITCESKDSLMMKFGQFM